MKRDHHQLNPSPPPPSKQQTTSGGASGSSSAAGKSKLWEDELPPDGGMDELLAVLGYKVKSSDMAEVAQKLEQLEEAMGSFQEDGGLSQLASDTVHYDPSNLSSWLENMLSEFNPPATAGAAAPSPFDSLPTAESSNLGSIGFSPDGAVHHRTVLDESCSPDYDLKAIPGKALYSNYTHRPQQTSQNQFDSSSSSSGSFSRDSKRLKLASSDNTNTNSNDDNNLLSTESARPVILADSQENGIRLVQSLMACAEAVQHNNLKRADAFVKQIRLLAISQAGAMGKVATYFAEALARRIYGVYPQNSIDHYLSDSLHMNFYESCPYLKFAHFTANQAILEAFEGKKRVHVIDFSMNQGLQWPALMQALALRPGGPPSFRLTGIGPPSPDNTDHLQEVGWKLAQLAETIHVKFEYRGFVANSLADLDASMLDLRPSEVDSVAVNSVFELHKLLARPGAIDKVLSVVKNIKPDIFTVVEQEANHNGPAFLDRFNESLHYYSTMFDSLEGSASSEDKAMTEVYLGNQICNVVACEGVDRIERHEKLAQWRTRFGSAGFSPAHLGSNAYRQASMLLALFAGGDGYKVEENNGCLMLGWYTRPLIATSAWKLSGNTVFAH